MRNRSWSFQRVGGWKGPRGARSGWDERERDEWGESQRGLEQIWKQRCSHLMFHSLPCNMFTLCRLNHLQRCILVSWEISWHCMIRYAVMHEIRATNTLQANHRFTLYIIIWCFFIILHGILYIVYHTSYHILHIIPQILYCIDIRNYILFVVYCTIISYQFIS